MNGAITPIDWPFEIRKKEQEERSSPTMAVLIARLNETMTLLGKLSFSVGQLHDRMDELEAQMKGKK